VIILDKAVLGDMTLVELEISLEDLNAITNGLRI
jgi:hypothetical protein